MYVRCFLHVVASRVVASRLVVVSRSGMVRVRLAVMYGSMREEKTEGERVVDGRKFWGVLGHGDLPIEEMG